jgi:hypothetical protein
MEALEFLKERKRMCRSFGGSCKGCPLEGTKCVVSRIVPDEDYKRIIATVEQWSKEHPRKTRQSVFLEQWPNCMMGDDGVVGMCPRNVDKMYVCNLSQFAECTDCRREFWMQEVE